MQDSELRYALKDVRSILIVADNAVSEKKGWFGANDEVSSVINEKGLKRLLNSAMKIKEARRDMNSIKITCLGKASSPSRGAASFLMGDTTDFDSEFVLQCQQRNLVYLMLKVGETVPADTVISPEDVSIKSATGPVLIRTSPSKSAGNSGKTRVSDATEALLRSVGHPTAGNCTITVLSTAHTEVSGEDWDNEFLKTEGPELLRIPLQYASITQATSKLYRIAQGFADRQKDPKARFSSTGSSATSLVTPIEVTRFENGVRVIFQPKESAYLSAKEERERLKKEEMERKAAENIKKKSGYVSPEAEAALIAKAQQDESASKSEPSKSKRKAKPEGGLELIVDGQPALRVRIRRCEMGPQTIVKEESESILLRAFKKGLEVLENDYKTIISENSII